MGGYDVLRRLQAGEEIPLDAFMRRLRSDHAVDRRARRPLQPCRRRCRLRRGRDPAAGDRHARDERWPRRSSRRHLLGGAGCVKAGRRGASPRSTVATAHEFTTAQVHYFLQQRVRRGLHASQPGEVRGLRGPSLLRRRRQEDGAVHRQDPDAAPSCRTSSSSTPACATIRSRTRCLPASATRWRARSSSSRVI